MKLTIEQSLDCQDVEINIKCGLMDARLKNLIEQIKLYSFSITGEKNGASFSIRLEDIFYFESVEEKTFLYCEKEVYSCALKLYELEEQLKATSFLRISKSCILNTAQLASVKTLFNGKFEALLNNGEVVLISRHYMGAFKEKFNL